GTTMAVILESLDDLAARVPDGTLLAVPPDYAGVAMAATRALIRRRARGLHLLAVPTSGLQADLLIGAGAVATLEAAAVTLGEHGMAPCFARAVRAGAIALKDSTCPAIHAALQAAEKGVPFLPLRGLIGSDVLRHRADWKLTVNPFDPDDPIVVLPALRPDVALFHAALADREGNVWIGRRRELVTMAHAAVQTLVTVEAIQDARLLDDPLRAAGTLPALYVQAVVVAPRGAWPLGFEDRYGPDDAHLGRYVRAAATAEGFARYLAENVLDARAA
ncbi:MAG: CoA transferase subunit A, partial [Alphaproteobacteria bacterium]